MDRTPSNTIAGFVSHIKQVNKNTRYGNRPLTTLTIGMRDKISKETSWRHVNIWGTPHIKKGDTVKVGEVKSFGRARYGKLVNHDVRNKRDRQILKAPAQKTPQQLQLL